MNLTRQHLQAVATSKLNDAVLLLAHDRWANAYYLAGYAVELALKAVIARSFQAEAIPDKAFVNAIYIHDLDRLIGLAELTAPLTQAFASPPFAGYWKVVRQWSEASRYEMIGELPARHLVEAVANPNEGVFPWITRHW